MLIEVSVKPVMAETTASELLRLLAYRMFQFKPTETPGGIRTPLS